MTIENVVDTIENCRYCLMCRHIASVEYVTHKETLSPHGWALVIASVKRGLLKWDADTVDAIYSAPDHGNSRAHCVTGQPLPEAIAAVRAEIVSQQLAPPVVYDLDESLREYGTPYAQRKPGVVPNEGGVALFVGDEAQYLWPKTLSVVSDMLVSIGINPIMIGLGRNNGYLASSLGLPDTARQLAEATLEELKTSGASRMMVLSPGDYFTFNQLYPERLGIDFPADVELIELTSFLAEQLEGGEIRFNKISSQIPFAYVDPTHAVRVTGRHDAPRQLLAAVMPGEPRELFWRRERGHPVGSTALQFTKPDIAEKLSRARLEDARQSGAQLLVCDDPGTLKQLDQFAEEFGLQVKGLYELLFEQLI
ncbi:MAG: (Fe-S)-binding protein [Chloroflexota bacterium]|nr:MAG: (Fe-S)-binding protein [Chloroflexota bacterium]